MSKSYNLYVNSSEKNDEYRSPKTESANNDAYFNVNWDQLFFDDKTTHYFEVTFTFNSFYEYPSYNLFQIVMDTNSSSLSYEIERKCQTNVLGYISTNNYNSNRVSKIISRPTNDFLNIKLVAEYGYFIPIPKQTIFKGTISGTTLTVDNTVHPNLLLNVDDVITGLNVVANTKIISRLNNYTYTLNISNTITATPLTATGKLQTDCAPWSMVINFKPIKN